jgi:hypothetical protein
MNNVVQASRRASQAKGNRANAANSSVRNKAVAAGAAVRIRANRTAAGTRAASFQRGSMRDSSEVWMAGRSSARVIKPNDMKMTPGRGGGWARSSTNARSNPDGGCRC